MLNNHHLNVKTNKSTAIVSTASTSISLPKNIENDNKAEPKQKEEDDNNNENVESYLVPWTYSCLFKPAIERVKHSHVEHLLEVFRHVDQASHSFLFDFAKLIFADSGLGNSINLQESYLRMHANAPNSDLEFPPRLSQIQEFQLFSVRRPFLETIKEIASSIKYLLDTTNAIIAIVPINYQHLVEKRKREFVQASKRFSNTLKDYFKRQEANQVYIAANHLILQTMKLCLAIRERVRMG
uniref:Uncharacterized protein n=1 Tax=Meloidogyne hapla TaxID=6305 RepID=A0A1I8C281_MELHA